MSDSEMTLSIWRFITQFMTHFIYILTPTVLMDLIADEQERMKVIISNRRLQNNNEQDRSDNQVLLYLMTHRPIEFSLYRVISLDSRSLLVLLSFSVTTVIAVTQITMNRTGVTRDIAANMTTTT